jgi:uncharacterized protein YfaS (alpha-2-macroglobulin family)
MAGMAAPVPMMEAMAVSRNNAMDTAVLTGRDSAELIKMAAPDAKMATPDAPHVRSYFPEALYINPEILTDGNGNASIEIPIADSITTWRMAMLASTQSGALGSHRRASRSFRTSLSIWICL